LFILIQHAAAYRLRKKHIEPEGRFTYFKGFSIHFSGVQKPFQQGECDCQPLLWEKYPEKETIENPT